MAENRVSTNTPDMDHVLHLLDGFKASATVSVAAELCIFDELQSLPKGGTTVDGLVNKLGWKKDPTRRLLDALVALKLIDKQVGSAGDQDTYTVTNAGQYLTKSSSGSIWGMKDAVTRFTKGLLHLTHEIKTASHSQDEFPEHITVHKTAAEIDEQAASKKHAHSHGHSHFSQDPEAFLNRYQMMNGMAAPHVKSLVRGFDLSQYKSVVDLGGGTGVVSFELARTYPDMNIILFEVPKVIDLLKDKFLAGNENLKVQFQPGDFMKDKLPETDLYLLSKIIHDWTDEQAKTILKKVHSALKPGGAIMLFEKCLNDGKDGPWEAHMWDMVVMSHCGGRLRSAMEYKQLLADCGFQKFQVKKTQTACTYDVLLAEKV